METTSVLIFITVIILTLSALSALNTLFGLVTRVRVLENNKRERVIVKYKLTGSGKTPWYATPFASGGDVYASEDVIIKPNTTRKVSTGLHIGLPEGFEAQLRPRSGLNVKGIFVSFGTIDNDYTGECCVIIHNTNDFDFKIMAGDRIAQIVVVPYYQANFVRCDILKKTLRGGNGFGSTGK